MSSNVHPIEWWQLALCLVFVAIAGTGSVVWKLRLEKDLAWGTVRTFAQLFLVGYLLKYVFEINHWALVVGLYMLMILAAAINIRGRVKERRITFFLPTYGAMVVSYLLVTVLVTRVIVQVEPWYKPQYFIPLGGMIIGNAMNAITIALERLFTDLRQRGDEIELRLALGATANEATTDLMRDAIRAGMLPSINSLMTVGLVSLPGMMTGQILAGSPPVTAIKYQIVVMLMIVAATAIGSILVVHLVRRRCFTSAYQLKL